MPVEIRELVIRALVDLESDPRESPPPRQSEAAVEQKDALVEAAVREVLRVLRANRER